MFPLPNAHQFFQVTRSRAVEGGIALGLTAAMAGRILDETRAHVLKAIPDLLGEDAPHLSGNAQHLRVALAMRHIVMAEMLEKLK